MRNKRLFVLILIFVLIASFSITASADMGPKPSVNITFENLGNELCYATLLSKYESTGPASAWDGVEEHANHNDNPDYAWSDLSYEIWKAFVDYNDSDGYYYLQETWQINETKTLNWTYYPPSPFKILLYFPESNTFAVSGIYERYAFDSYFTVDMSGFDINSVDYDEIKSNDTRYKEWRKELAVHQSYEVAGELFGLFVRIVLTILIEVLIALAFGFKEKKQLLFILAVNAVTQIILNVLLNIINYNLGGLMMAICYVLFEIVVFVLEAIIYSIFINKVSIKPKKVWFCVLYAFIANAFSFGLGAVIATYLPDVF